MLFIDFDKPNRVRVGGRATIADDGELLASYPGAEMVVTVAVNEVFPNCPRYIHRLGLQATSASVPDAQGVAPIADWKREPWACEVLAADDPARVR
jgi:hypothetical protein